MAGEGLGHAPGKVVRLAAGVDEELMMLEGVALFTKAAAEKDRKKSGVLRRQISRLKKKTRKMA